MKLKFLPFFLLFFIQLSAQQSFSLPDEVSYQKIHFRLLSNLMVLKVKLNGSPKNFILDSGAVNNIYFHSGKMDTLPNALHRRIKLKGLGGADEVDGVVTFNNQIAVKKYTANKTNIILVDSKNINFSSKLGIPIHGIIGADFFREHLVFINYKSKYIKVYNKKNPKKPSNKYESLPIELDKGKPYIKLKNNTFPTKLDSLNLLIDTGSSDALWIVNNNNTPIRGKFFEDFLGKSLTGNLYGKRSFVDNFTFGSFKFDKVLTAFLNNSTVFAKNNFRQGSVGGELLKRFYVYFDYPNGKIHIKKNNQFKQPFLYNVSGIEFVYNGDILVYEQNENRFRTDQQGQSFVFDSNYTFKKKPTFVIEYIRPKSPADVSGLQVGDIISGINHYDITQLSVNKLDAYLFKKSDVTIEVEIIRNNQYFAYTIDMFKQL